MKKYSSELAFVDLLFNLLVGFVSLLLLAFLFINPIAKEGKIDPVAKLLVVITWPDKSSADIDMWVRGPDRTVVSYSGKDKGYMILERDDLGVSNDTIKVDGETVHIQRNIESLSITKLLKGEFVINVMNYSYKFTEYRGYTEAEKYPIPVDIKVYQMNPFKILFVRRITLEYRQEKTVVSFEVLDNGVITDLRTDVNIPLYYANKPTREFR
jgi:hypothetical protein